MNLKPLVNILREEKQLHEKMLSSKEEERRYLATGDAHSLIKVTEKIQDLADQIAELEELRTKITNELAEELGIDKTNPTLKDILEKIPPENNSDLEQSGADLRNVVFQLKQSNQSNKILLQNAVATINAEIAEVIKPEESGVYTKHGKRGKQGVPRAGLNVRA